MRFPRSLKGIASDAFVHFLKSKGLALLSLQIDSEKSSISLGVRFKGESETLTIDAKYDLIPEGKNGVKITEIHTSKGWMNVLASLLVKDQYIDLDGKIDPKYLEAAKKIL